MYKAKRSALVWTGYLGLCAVASAWLGCAADAGQSEQEAAASSLDRDVLATVTWGADERYEFVEVDSEIVVGRGMWNADKPSSMADAIRALPGDATLLQTYDLLAGSRASAKDRERLAEVQARIEQRIESKRSAQPAGAQTDELIDPGTDDGELLVEKELPTDPAWFTANFCVKPSTSSLQHMMCLTNVKHCNYRSYPEHVDATSHHMFLFNQESAGAANVQGLMQWRNCASCNWNNIEVIEVPPRFVTTTQSWSPNFRRRVSVGFHCSEYSVSEFWWGRT